MNLSFIIWNGSPELFSVGQITLRWYGLLFALGFLLSQQLLIYIYRKEGKQEKEVDTLTIVMVISTILGARLGHVIFYQPEMLWENPLGVLLPFEFNPFRFTGLQGLASHGGAFAILLGLWWYARKKKQSYLVVLDRIVILVAITGACIRLGNFFNSEIIGKPTNMPWGVVFSSRLTNALEYDGPAGTPVQKAIVVRDEINPVRDSVLMAETGSVPVILYVMFKPDVSEAEVGSFMNNRTQTYLNNYAEYFRVKQVGLPEYSQVKESTGYVAKMELIGVARHPSQLYESISCLLLFAGLFWYWNRHRNNLP
ncbi:MAG: prolipoprotein diacylglyceryl transferase, partial [Bacteroidota bacterium]